MGQPAGEPWHTAQWYTSPWNHDPEVASGFAFHPELKIHDVTLRDGEQQAGVESGIISTWVRNVRDTDLTEAFPYLPGLVGQNGPRLVLGKGSGLDNVAEGLEQLGIEASDEQRPEILRRVKARSLELGGLVDDGQLAEIAADVTGA